MWFAFLLTIEAYRRFKDVVDSCYGSHLQHDYTTKIETFKTSYQKLRIPITPKIHAVIFHITEFCSSKGKGLGPWSEQTSESVHRDFLRVWNNYKIRSTQNNNYGKQLLSAVCKYNSTHLWIYEFRCDLNHYWVLGELSWWICYCH